MESKLVTSNSEYHLEADTCVRVWDRRQERWLEEHPALGQRLIGSVGMTDTGSYRFTFGAPVLGDRLLFSNDLLTSPLRERCPEQLERRVS